MRRAARPRPAHRLRASSRSVCPALHDVPRIQTGRSAGRSTGMDERVHPADDERGDIHPLPVPRRRFLTASAMAIAGGVLFSCTGGKKTPVVTDAPLRIDTHWPVKRVIYVMLENRSFDNLFGKFPGVNGAQIGVKDGKEVPLGRCPDWLPGDLPHDRMASLNDLNAGKLARFGAGLYGDPLADA